MTMKGFTFSISNEELDAMLRFALSFVVGPDMERISNPAATLQLRLLEEEGVCGDEDGSVEFKDISDDLDRSFFVVTFREMPRSVSRAGLYTREELFNGVRNEMIARISMNSTAKDSAMLLAERIGIDMSI